MKKWVLGSMAVGLAMTGVLAGCSGKSEENEASGAAGSDKVVTLKFWGAVPPESGPAKVVENWNKTHPNIQVEYTRYVNDDVGNTKLETALLANGQVDLFVSYRTDRAVKRVEAGMTQPLDEYVAKDNINLTENFGEKAITRFDGKVHFIPAIILNDFVSLNKKKLDAAGLPVPQSWTWDDYAKYAQKMTSGEGPNKVWGSYIGGPTPKIYEYIVDRGVKVALGPDILYKSDGTSNFDNPAFKQILDHQVNLENNLKVQMPYAEAKASKTQGDQLFLSEKSAMLWWTSAVIRSIKDTKNFPHDFITAFAPAPKLHADDKFITGGTGYLDFVSINSRSKEKEAAWQFLKWYVMEGNEPMIPDGRVPSWKKADVNKVVSQILGDQAEKLFDVESFKRSLFLDKEFIADTKFDKIPELQKIVEEEAQRALIGEQTTQQAIDNMKKRSDAELKQK